MDRTVNENGFETVERYCYVVGKNTSVIRKISGNDKTFTCANSDECIKNGGCKNRMCKAFLTSDE